MKLHGKAQETCQLILKTFEHPDRLPAALAPIFIHRRDLSPCRAWSWHNQMLVALAGTGDARGFRQWKEIGRHVVKGSRCFHILAPITIRKDGKEPGEGPAVAVIGFRTVPVFRLEDTDGDPLPPNPYADWIQRLPLVDVARQWGITVDTYNGEGSGALGYTRPGESIALGVENLSTWAHELIHNADFHADRPQGDRKADREIVAELGGAVLLRCLGMDTDADLGGCFEYCRGYAEREKKQLISVCNRLIARTCAAVDLVLTTAEGIQKAQKTGVAA